MPYSKKTPPAMKVPKKRKQTSQTTKRKTVTSQPLGESNPEYGSSAGSRNCLDGCLKRAEKAQKTKKVISTDEMFD